MFDEKIELNLDNPIFTIYVNVENLSHESVHRIMSDAKKAFDIYSNITTWIMPSNVNKIECVYDGKSKIREAELTGLIKELNDRIEILSKSNTYEDFKINIRDWRINQTLNGEVQE
jgi:hypothetical protein